MIKYSQRINESYRNELEDRLRLGKMEAQLLKETADYLYTNVRIMDNIIEGLQMWTAGSLREDIDRLTFVLGIIHLLNLYRKNMEENEGLIPQYLTSLRVPSVPGEGDTRSRPWHFEADVEHYSPLKGVYKELVDMGIKQDTIDRLYLDGHFLEVYEICLENVVTLTALKETENPAPVDLSEGIFLMDDRFRRFYARLFMDRIDDEIGFYGCLEKIVSILKEKGQKNES